MKAQRKKRDQKQTISDPKFEDNQHGHENNYSYQAQENVGKIFLPKTEIYKK